MKQTEHKRIKQGLMPGELLVLDSKHRKSVVKNILKTKIRPKLNRRIDKMLKSDEE